MDTTMKQRLRGALIGALGLGGGVLSGIGVGLIVWSNLIVWLDRMITIQIPSMIWEIGGDTVPYLVSIALGGGLGGAIGGFALSASRQSTRWLRYIWVGALSFAVSSVLVGYPSYDILYLVGFYGGSEHGALYLFGVPIGAVMGILSSLLLGLMTVGRKKIGSLVFYSSLGFGIGGYFGGATYFLSDILLDFDLSTLSIMENLLALGRLFIFGAIGGAALGAFYSSLPGDESE